jgi:hypothetical protein
MDMSYPDVYVSTLRHFFFPSINPHFPLSDSPSFYPIMKVGHVLKFAVFSDAASNIFQPIHVILISVVSAVSHHRLQKFKLHVVVIREPAGRPPAAVPISSVQFPIQPLHQFKRQPPQLIPQLIEPSAGDAARDRCPRQPPPPLQRCPSRHRRRRWPTWWSSSSATTSPRTPPSSPAPLIPTCSRFWSDLITTMRQAVYAEAMAMVEYQHATATGSAGAGKKLNCSPQVAPISPQSPLIEGEVWTG